MGQIHDPGADCSYCNTASTTAGYLIQRVRGKSWYTVMEEYLFEGLGLEHAIVQPADALLHRNTVGHFLDPESGEFRRTSHAFLPQSFAPAGATAMLSATDLVSFAAAHIGNGLGLNGEQVVSEGSARAMRKETAQFKSYGPRMGFGLGWMLSRDDHFTHGGGGPGILSNLTAVPSKDYAIAVLTNVEHGGVLIGEATNTWGERVAGIEPAPAPDYPFIDTDVDLGRYIGVYSGVAVKNEIVEHEGGLGFAATATHRFYDSTSLERSPVAPLKPVAEDAFGFAAPGATSAQAVIRFVNPGADGRPRHLASGGRLYLRRA
jgi:CubicO group peptidase (beta-lactamase class C family)